jgi:diguanylate cyclase (GGDEF)-like protein/PAS domain S-box-containing protein
MSATKSTNNTSKKLRYYTEVFENTTDVIYLIEVTEEGRFIHLEINAAFSQEVVFLKEALIGHYVDELENKELRDILIRKYTSCLEAGGKTEFIDDYYLPIGTRTYHSTLSPIRDGNGRIHRIVGVARDITEQKYNMDQLTAKSQEFRTLAENSPDIIVRYDKELNCIYTNPAWERIRSISSVGVLGETPIHTSPRPFQMTTTYETNLNRVLKSKEVGDVELTLVDEEGETHFFTQRIVPEFDEEGNILGILTIARDITAYKKLQKTLLTREREFRSLSYNIPDNIARWDTQGQYLYVNPVHERTLGKSASEIIGTFIPDSHEAIKAAITQVAATGNQTTVSQSILTKEGSIQHHEVSIVPEKDGSGKIISILGVGRDVTERKRAEDELQQALEFNQEVINTIPDLLFELDSQGNYLNIWAQDERLLATQKAILMGKNVRDILPSDAIETTFQTLREVDETGQSLGNTMHLDLPEGRKYFELSASKKKSSGTYIILSREITERKRSEEHLERTKAKLSAIISTIPDLIWVKDVEGVYLMCNPAFENFFGAPCAEIIGKTDYDFISRSQADFFRQKDREAMESGEMQINEERIVFANNGQSALLETRKIPVYNGNHFMGVLGIGRDITHQKQLEEKILLNGNRLKEAQKIAKIGSWELEFPGLRLHWSDEVYRILEIPQGEFEPSYDHFLNCIHPEERPLIDTMFHTSLKNKTPYDMVHRLLMSDGRIKYVHEQGETLYDEEGIPYRSIGTIQDVTKQKNVEKKIEHMAHHDSLTGLPNRILAKERAEQIMENVKNSDYYAAFLFIDLDGFKAINDSLGHSAGDAMLKLITTRLKECVRESDTISRLGGDEFLVILSEIKEVCNVTAVAEKILIALEKPFEIATHILSSSASIGIALYPDHAESFEALLQYADTAMYKAKDSGKNSYCFYTQQMAHNLIGQFKIQNDLKNALINGEFILYYQPQIDLSTRTIIGAEALIRWSHPQLGMIPPMNFISIAESTGLIVPIGEWVIREACAQAARWCDMGMNLTVAVNISAVQFKRGNLQEIVKSAISDTGIDPKCLELELTESIIMHDAEKTLQTVRNLKSYGILLSIDDFGTGYSSLAYLKRFAVDKLKIDQSFIRDVLSDQEDAVIVSTIVQMAKNLNLKTIAEGVENGEILSFVEGFGCDEVQGYHFAKPMEAEAFEVYYNNFHSEEKR